MLPEFELRVMFTTYFVCADDKSRQINPNKDVALYGYGTVAWKDKEEWRQKDLVRFQSNADGGGHCDDADIENPNVPM